MTITAASPGEAFSVSDVRAELGEGPVWTDSALWFADIKGRRIHRYDPKSGQRTSWQAPEQVGFVLPADDGNFIAGLQSGLHRFDAGSGEFALLAPVDANRPGNRLNDATVDREGRLWFGTMDNDEKASSGAFYRYQRGVVSPTGIDGIGITNGPAVSPDGRRLYTVNTLARLVSVSTIREDGSLAETRPFLSIEPGDGNPDGPTVDSEGCLWVALYGGWEARRYSPAAELIGRVRFPVKNITKIAFGGVGLRTLYATTARHLLNPEELAEQPLAGNLFACEVDVPGIATPLVVLS